LATTINTSSGDLNIGSATGVIQIGSAGSIFSNRVAAGVFLNGRLTTDTFDKISLHTTSHLLMGSGTSAQDCRIWRSGATTITMDNNSTGAITLTSNAGTFNNWATWNRAGLMTLATSSGGGITLSANAAGNITLTSGTGNIIVGRPITTSAGDLTLNPAGTNIVCSSKSLTGVLSLQTPTINTASGDISIAPAGTNINVNNKIISNIQAIIGFGIEPQIRPAAGWGRTRFSNNAVTGNIVLETGSTLPGFQAISFNGYSDGAEQRYDTTKRRWRQMCFQNASSDNYTLDSFDGTITRTHFTINPSSSESVSFPQGLLTTSVSTSTGNLILNAQGSSIDCSGKSLINVGSISSTGRIFAYCSTTAVSNAVGTSQLLPNTVITGSNTFAANQLQQGQGFVMKMWFNISATVTTVNFQVNYNGQLIRSLVINGTAGDYYYELNIHLVAASGAANNVQSIGQLFQNGVASVIDTNANVVATPITYAAASSFSHQVSMTVTPPPSNFHLRRWSINSA
jgi:hypothetical protein